MKDHDLEKLDFNENKFNSGYKDIEFMQDLNLDKENMEEVVEVEDVNYKENIEFFNSEIIDLSNNEDCIPDSELEIDEKDNLKFGKFKKIKKIFLFILIACLISIISYFMTSFILSKSIEGKKERTYDFLNSFSSSFSAFYNDNSYFNIRDNYSEDEKKHEIENYLMRFEVLSDFKFNYQTIEIFKNGIKIEIKDKLDEFNMPYKFYIGFDTDNLGLNNFILYSAGANKVYEDSSYLSGEFGDDIILLMQEEI